MTPTVNLIAAHSRALELALAYVDAEEKLYRASEEWFPTLRALREVDELLLTASPFADRPAIERERLATVPVDASEGQGHAVARSGNPARAIAERLVAEGAATSADADRLQLVHDTYKAHSERMPSGQKWLTATLGLIAIAGKLVPKEVFELFDLERNYGWYQFAITIVAIYVIVVFGFIWWRFRRSLRRRRRAEHVIDAAVLHLRLGV